MSHLDVLRRQVDELTARVEHLEAARAPAEGVDEQDVLDQFGLREPVAGSLHGRLR